MTRPAAVHIIHVEMDSRTVIQRLEDAGWRLVRVRGSHHQFRHPSHPKRVTVPHPRRDIPVGTLKSIERQSGLKLTQEARPGRVAARQMIAADNDHHAA